MVVLFLFLAILITCLVLRSIYFAVDLAGLHQLIVGADGADAAAVHHDDAVRVLHRGHALGDDDLCGLGDKLTEALGGSSASVWVSTALVESSKISTLGFFSSARAMHRRCFWPPETLDAALLDPGVVLIRELLDKFVGLGQLAGLHASPRRWRPGCPSAGCL